MNTPPRPLAGLALIVIAALVSGCGSGTPAASIRGDGSYVTAAAQKGVKFSECMRSNGVPTFPDPNASGTFTIDEVANGTSLDTSSPTFTQALGACKSLEPAGFEGGTRSTQQQAAALQFPMAHPAVAAIIPGARSVAEVEENVRLMSLPIPHDFWHELRRLELLPPEAPLPRQ